MGVTAADFDGDGYPDIYVANDKTENFLFHNKHDGTFEEIALDAGAAFGQNGESTSAMGPVFFDVEQQRASRPVGERFQVQPPAARTPASCRSPTSPSRPASRNWRRNTPVGARAPTISTTSGLRDIIIAHGGLIHLIPQEHSVFRNLGGGKFEDVSTGAGPILATKSVGRGACFADYDTDGRVDAYLVNLGAPGALLHNVTTPVGHWLKINLVGTKSNRDGIGAVVEVEAGGVKQRAERTAGSGYLSQDDWRLHFGLGAATKADKITVVWPSGIHQVVENIPAGQVFTITEK